MFAFQGLRMQEALRALVTTSKSRNYYHFRHGRSLR
jgi:hypothetical protein